MQHNLINGIVSDVHPDDEMFLFFASHPQLMDDPLRHYFISGEHMLRDLTSILKESGVELSGVQNFLEFACGYGRFTRHLLKVLPADKVTVSDVYKNAVDFQKQKFHVSGFYSDFNPDIPIFPKKFDVIFVASLFSHLPIGTWSVWLKKLYSTLAPGGLLVFTTHGPSCMANPEMMPSSGFCYMNMSESKSHSFDNYGTTYVTESFVRDAVKSHLNSEVLHLVPKGMWNYQDVYVVKN